MGTSSSYGGPGDKISLLPSWALPGGEGIADSAEGEGEEDADAADGADADGDGESSDADAEGHDAPGTGDGDTDLSPDANEPAGGTEDSEQQVSIPAHVPHYWRSAKLQLGKAISERTGRRGYASAGKAYVRARGGPKQAATTSRSARTATANLGRFLSDVRRNGFNQALHHLGLESVIGRDAHTVFAAILDAVAPEGKTREEVATRDAISETLADLFGQFVANDPSGASFVEAMTADAIKIAIEASIIAAAFNRWVGDLARQLEEKAVSAAEALRIERDIHQYMVDTVHLDLMGKDPLKMDWDTEGRALIDALYEVAYRMLGGDE